MDSKRLYQRLDEDFELNLRKDDWSEMDFNEFISDIFKKRQMGVLLDNSEETRKVYAAVFPSDNVLSKLLECGEENILLLVHHPMVWDIRKDPVVFESIGPQFMQRLRERKISIYALHVPLDKTGKYSTSSTLAKALGIREEGEFYEYFGVKVGVIGKTDLKEPEELADKVAFIVGHRTKLWKYGTGDIRDGRVALVAGGGNEIEVLNEIAQLGINTFVTGVILLNDHSREAHRTAKENGINIIGATHYSTEKFACIAICDYFREMGLPCEFIEDDPVLEDMG